MTKLEELDKKLHETEFYELCNMMGKKWILLILISIYANVHTFSGMMKSIPNINTSILTKRLKELVDKDYIIKSPKAEYHLNTKWKNLIDWLKSFKERTIETGKNKQIKKI